MTKFIETSSGVFVSVSDVARIAAKKSSGGLPMSVIKVRDVNGGSLDFECYDPATEIAEWLNSTVIPAEPGYFLVSKFVDDATFEEFTKWMAPVIAWRIDANGYPTPLTVDGAWDGVDPQQLIVNPNGIAVDQGNRSYASLQEAYGVLKAEESRQKDNPA